MHTMVQEGQCGDRGGGGGFFQVEVVAYFKYIGGGVPSGGDSSLHGENQQNCAT